MDKNIKQVIARYIPECKVESIIDKGRWVNHTYKVNSSNGKSVILKLKVHSEWGDLKHLVTVEQLFEKCGFPAPRTLAVDESCELLPYPYIIQEYLDGIQLDKLVKQANVKDRVEIYRAIGKFYRKMHNIHNTQSGLWSENPQKILYPISPNDYMYQAEIVNGSGKKAFEESKISQQLYERIQKLWLSNMEYLKNHQPSLIHGSPFIWTIYLDRIEEGWVITKLMSLGDVMWWDSAYDIAFLQYPPFGNITAKEWDGFKEGYGDLPDRKRILLYAVMQKLCAAMGVYMEPDMPQNEEYRRSCLLDIDQLLDEIERYS